MSREKHFVFQTRWNHDVSKQDVRHNDGCWIILCEVKCGDDENSALSLLEKKICKNALTVMW